MEKTFGETKIIFKEALNMREFQIVTRAIKEFQEIKDEIELVFKLFPVFVVTINGEMLSDEAKRKWIEDLTDLNQFQAISEVMWDLENDYVKWLDQKKKTK